MAPTRKTAFPASFASIVTQRRTSSTIEIAEIRSECGMMMVLSPTRNSLLRLSLPEMNGVPYATAASWQARAARTSAPRFSGLSGRPHEKLSRIAVRAGSPPTATTLRSASSIALAAMS